MRSVEPTRWEEGGGAPGRGCCEAGGGAGRDGKWDGELGPGEERRGGVGAGSRRRPDRDRFLPERRPALDLGAGGGRPRAGDREISRPALSPAGSGGARGSSSGPVRSSAAGGARAGAREGGRREGPGAQVTGWQPRSGRLAAAAPPPPPAAPLAAAAATAGRSFTPDPRSERGARPASATRRRLGVRSAQTRRRRQSLGCGRRPGLGALRRRRGGCEAADPCAAPQPLSQRQRPGQPRWPCAPAALG